MQKVIQQQQAGLERLTNILGSNILAHHAKKWLSIFLEIALYLLFVSGIVAIICLPFMVDPNSSPEQQIAQEKLIHVCQVLITIFSAPAPILAVLLTRNRKKNELIKQAFEEVKAMKNKLLPYLTE